MSRGHPCVVQSCCFNGTQIQNNRTKLRFIASIKMAEVVNRLHTKESKARAKSAVEHYLKEKVLYEDFPSSYRNAIVNYITHIYNIPP